MNRQINRVKIINANSSLTLEWEINYYIKHSLKEDEFCSSISTINSALPNDAFRAMLIISRLIH